MVSYTTVISCLSKASGDHHINQAQEVFNQMVKQGVRPTVTTVGALIHGHARMGDLETVRALPPPINPIKHCRGCVTTDQ